MLDISVLILFFNRPESLAKVFEQVRKAQPARLFLYQDLSLIHISEPTRPY